MKTAIITGASSGLGAEFARRVACRNDIERIILVARREDRLEQLAYKIGDKADILALDLTRADAVDAVREKLGADKLVLLINCAGYGKMGKVGMPEEKQCGMIELNCCALTALCAFAADVMPRNARIINIASIAAFVPTPNLTVYGATKAYVLSFSKALHRELKDKNISVTAVCPGPADTEFFAVSGTDNSKLFARLVHLSAEYVVKSALKASEKRRWVCTPHPFYKFYRFISKILPDRLLIRFTEV